MTGSLAGGVQVDGRARTRTGATVPPLPEYATCISPPAAPAAHQPLQQRGALARGAAALAARSHVRSQPLAGGEVLIPADIAGMVIGQADGPLLDRHLDSADAHLAVLVDALRRCVVRPNTNAPAYAGLVRKSCTAP